MEINPAEISVRGKVLKVPAVRINDITIIVTGRWLKTASIKDEFWLAGELVEDPEVIIANLKQQKLNADIFTFSQKLPKIEPKYKYHLEWNNVAAIPISGFADWWENRLPQETRKNVRRAGRRGVVIKKVQFDNALIEAIVDINNETPIRQGRRFWHYGKSFDTVKRDYSAFLDRSEFWGAYAGTEMIGFIRLIYLGKTANILQILCKNKHFDKRPGNVLIAKAVEACAEKRISHLVYGQYVYGGNTKSPLTEFKRRNGFEQILIPTYYVPLTLKGRLFLELRLHRGISRIIPKRLLSLLIELRSKLNERKATKREPTALSAE